MPFGSAFLGYPAIVLFDVVVASFQVAALILFRRNRDLRSRWHLGRRIEVTKRADRFARQGHHSPSPAPP